MMPCDLWNRLRGASVLITGGTGFVGRWLLTHFLREEAARGLDAHVTVVTRRPDAFDRLAPDIARDRRVRLLTGDVRDFDARGPSFSHVIHGAAAASAALNREDPDEMLSTLVDGTRHVCELVESQGRARVLLLSSGAVYRQPTRPGVPIAESAPMGPEAPDEASAYHAGKRSAERVAVESSRRACYPLTVARLFSFVGPYLPLDAHYAVGNFIRDALAGGPVVVRGTGRPVRSYLYASDMALWLWGMLLDPRAENEVFNVGSEVAVSVADAARLVAALVDPPACIDMVGSDETGGGGEWYVPSTLKARRCLGLRESVGLSEAIRLTIGFHRRKA
jgi:dTDP-glucose 4,6-dehydratase